MNSTEIVFLISTLILTLPTLVLFTVDLLMHFWTRGRFREGKKFLSTEFQEFICSPFFGKGNVDASISFVTLNLSFGLIFSFLIATIYDKTSIIGILIVVTTIFLLILPKYVLDFFVAFKWNTKSKDSDRLINLEKQIEELKNKSR
jgi:hypothetical protein